MAVSKKAEEVIKKVEETVEKTVEANKPAVEKAVKKAATTAKQTASTTAKKAATTARKAAAKFEPKKTTVVFEANGRSYTEADIVKAVTKACKGKTAKKLEIYVNTNENAAYYVIDGVGSEDYKVEL